MALAFSVAPPQTTPRQTASACAEAARDVVGGRVRLVVPTPPVPIVVGDREDGLQLVLTFPTAGGDGELWAGVEADELPQPVRDALREQLARVWRAQEERLEQMQEIERLQFQLAALQQVVRTLAAVRGREETERLILDSVGEAFFAWWATLYRTTEDGYRCRAVRALRGEEVAPLLPAEVVRAVAPAGPTPVVPDRDAEIRRHLPQDVAVIAPLDLEEGGAGLLALGPRITDAPYDKHDLALLRALADSSAVALRNADLLERLRAQATSDPLTGCHNRRGFDEHLATEFSRARRYQRPLAVVLLDIDHFKAVNDELGHEVGDNALRRIGEALCQAGRATDWVCRYGGEEFAVLCPETSKEEALLFAERLRVLIEGLPPTEEVPRRLTTSVGVSALPSDADDPVELVRAADRALYEAKAAGRNQVAAA